MKRLLFLAIYLLCSTPTFSQIYDISEAPENIRGKLQPALRISLGNVEKTLATDVWKSYVREKGGNVLGLFDFTAKNLVINNLDYKKVTIYTKYREVDTTLTMIALFTQKNNPLNEKDNPKQILAAKKFLLDYGVKVFEADLKKQITNARQNLAKKKRTQEMLEKKIENTDLNIQRYLNLLERAYADTIITNAELEIIKTQFVSQETYIKSLENRLSNFSKLKPKLDEADASPSSLERIKKDILSQKELKLSERESDASADSPPPAKQPVPPEGNKGT